MIYSRRGTRLMAEASLLGVVIGTLVVLPWTRHGYLLLLDWVSGPNQTLTPGVYGLSGSALDSMPFRIGTQAMRNIFGPSVTAWLMIWLYFPLAAGGIAAATRGTRWRVYPAVVLFLCNPFVVDRVRAGHVSTLLCLALLPWIFTASVHARKQRKWFAVRPALWYSLAMAISPHAAWLGGVTVLATWLLPFPTRKDAVRAVSTVLMAGLVYAYALVVWVTGARTLNVTNADLDAFATRPGWGGALGAVIALRGFWRANSPEWQPWSGQFWVIPVLLTTLVAIGVGLILRAREDPLRGVPLVALTAAGLVLATGVSGPIAGLYRFLFDHLPLFEAMREQQKWLMLAVMGYAVGFGAAVEAVARWGARAAQAREGPSQTSLEIMPLAAPHAWGSRTAVLLACLPMAAVIPALAWGLGGSISSSEYPAVWDRANEAMKAGDGLVLFLPWHGYQPFGFTDGRSVATPAGAFFERDALASDAVQLPQLATDSTSRRTAYVDRLVSIGGGADFGRSLAPLGVEWVFVADNEASLDYGWVDRQPSLERVDVGPGARLYRVLPQGVGRVVSARSLDFDQAQAALAEGAVGTEAILDPKVDSADGARSDTWGGLRKVAPTEWDVDQGTPGWVLVPEEWSPNWKLDSNPGVPTLAGTIAYRVGSAPTKVEFTTWKKLRPALFISLLALAALVAAGVVEHRRDTGLLIPSWLKRSPPPEADRWP